MSDLQNVAEVVVIGVIGLGMCVELAFLFAALFKSDKKPASHPCSSHPGRAWVILLATSHDNAVHVMVSSSSSPPAPGGGHEPSPSPGGPSLSSQISGGGGGWGGGDAAEDPEPPLPPPVGARVWCRGLPGTTELNGRLGRVVANVGRGC